MSIKSKHRVKRVFYRNGVAAIEEVFLGRTLHGPRKTWHRNGQLESEEPYHFGLLHGVCRQWNEQGTLLGSYRVINGTGIQRSWYEDGALQLEFSTVSGRATGRKRFWLRDGSLVSEKWRIEDRDVSRKEYLKAAASHADWPQYPREPGRQRTLTRRQFEVRVFRFHCEWLLSKTNNRDASQWLADGSATTRALGRLSFRKAHSLVAALQTRKAGQVLAVDIYHSKQGKEFCDTLLIRLPESKRQRLAIRRLLRSLPLRAHCAVQPDKNGREKWLYVYFG